MRPSMGVGPRATRPMPMKWMAAGLLVMIGVAAVALVVLGPGGLTADPGTDGDVGEARPNVLILYTDDQRRDSMAFMPETKARLFDGGVVFERAFAPTPLCCPARASLLTGLYAHRHGVTFNGQTLNLSTVADDLQDAGYRTGYFGKYMNGWSGQPRPEYDRWVSFQADQWWDYTDPRIHVDDERSQADGYTTHILRDHALSFLDGAADDDAPFFAIVAFNAPHHPATPAPGDEGLYPDLTPHRPPNYDEADVSDKPAWVQGRARITADRADRIDALRADMLRTLNAVDGAVAALDDRLAEHGMVNDTLVVYLSDNGYLWGEHRLGDKNLPYEEAIRVPMALRYPPLTGAGPGPGPADRSELVANVDVTATVYDLAGVDPPRALDGRSLVPLLEGNATGWRDALLIEAWRPPDRSFAWAGIRADRYVYVAWDGGDVELYDLLQDPHQLESLAGDPDYREVEQAMLERLLSRRPDVAGWVGEAGPSG